MNTTTAGSNDPNDRVVGLIDDAFVFDGTHVFRTGGPGKPKLPLGDLPLDDGLI